MKRKKIVMLAVLLGLAVGGFSLLSAEEMSGMKKADQMQAPSGSDQDTQTRSDILYSCACGEGCSCNSVSTKPGNCGCGKPMAWGHVVRVEEDEALVCTCSEGCTCKQDASDPTLCGCGKPLKRVSLKDSGLYFCNCGGSCACNTLSDEAGPCKCGMKLKQH